VCAEDGAKGVTVDGPRLYLQQFVAQQKASGMLLCLCSKNKEEDVVATFEEQQAMALRFSDFIATRINWARKPDNLRSLAGELDLALDSFIFLDDNPLECAEMEADCPEVVTVCLQDPDVISEILSNVWAFDRLAVSSEDRIKTELYRHDLERQKLARQAPTMEQFIEDLSLMVDILPMTPEETARVSQLSFRVNQFNLTQRRYIEAELRQRCARGECEGLTVRVRDRFGDYGLVGCVIFEKSDHRLRVEAFLLSCRALGRKVEYTMLNELGRIAFENGASEIEIPFRITDRNVPAQEFVRAIGGQFSNVGEQPIAVVLPADKASASWNMNRQSPWPQEQAADRPSAHQPIHESSQATVLSRIARELRDVGSILSAIDAEKAPRTAELENTVYPLQTDTESTLARIWSEVIGVDVSDACTDFFAYGGDSLLAVRVLSRIWDAFHVEIPLDVLFASRLTIRQISSTIDQMMAASPASHKQDVVIQSARNQ
jgi:FkbH-like protein